MIILMPVVEDSLGGDEDDTWVRWRTSLIALGKQIVHCIEDCVVELADLYFQVRDCDCDVRTLRRTWLDAVDPASHHLGTVPLKTIEPSSSFAVVQTCPCDSALHPSSDGHR